MDKDLLETDLIQKILVRLPVVSLLRFKSVCKSWCALIHSPSFTHLHTTTFNSSSSSSSRFGSFILHAAVDFEERFREDAVFMLSSESESECCVSRPGSWYSGSFGLWSTGFNDNDDEQQQQLVLKLENLGFPSCYNFGKPPHMVMVVVGSCNGLICLHDSERRDVSLWNPATGQFRILPKSSSMTIAAGDVHRLFAFGFDDETKDYKVVLLSVFNRRMVNYELAPMECICQVEVYSLSTDSWKLLKGITSLPGSPFPYPPDSSSSELFYLNGSCCFFMAKLLYSSSEEEEQCIPPPKSHDKFIISLDLTTEIITPIMLPYHHRLEQLYLCYLGKKIALFTTFAYKDVYDVNDPRCSWENFCIWVFNEHRSSSVNHEFWTEFHIFRIQLGLPGERNIPRGISNDGVFALLETEIHGGLGNKKKKKMRLYNVVTKEVKKNFLSCDQVLSKAYAYKPSLVSIIGPSVVSIIGEAETAADDMMVIGKAAAAAEMDWKCCTLQNQPADDNRVIGGAI